MVDDFGTDPLAVDDPGGRPARVAGPAAGPAPGWTPEFAAARAGDDAVFGLRWAGAMFYGCSIPDRHARRPATVTLADGVPPAAAAVAEGLFLTHPDPVGRRVMLNDFYHMSDHRLDRWYAAVRSYRVDPDGAERLVMTVHPHVVCLGGGWTTHDTKALETWGRTSGGDWELRAMKDVTTPLGGLIWTD